MSLRALATDGALSFAWPLALPPDGTYPCVVRDRPTRLTIDGPRVRVDEPVPADGPLEVGPVAPIPAV